MPIRLNDFSRFKDTEPVVKDGKETFGLWARPKETDLNSLRDRDKKTIRITQRWAGRPDLIADDNYDTPLLAWVVIMSNRPRNTVGWPFAGTEITIPVKSAVARFL